MTSKKAKTIQKFERSTLKVTEGINLNFEGEKNYRNLGGKIKNKILYHRWLKYRGYELSQIASPFHIWHHIRFNYREYKGQSGLAKQKSKSNLNEEFRWTDRPRERQTDRQDDL